MPASYVPLPVLILNLGGEMMYILVQRLQAQEIPPDRAAKVLQDVVGTMYGAKFIEELFKPAIMYSSAATRAIFDRIAHSSIMKLNKTSMDKLYDLMTMGFKYQLVQAVHPGELLQITLNHLETLRKMVEKSAPVTRQIDIAIEQFSTLYKSSSMGVLDLVRWNLFAFFQGKRIRVSLFLQEDMQNSNGSLVKNIATPAPRGAEVPGVIRYFDASGKQTKTANFNTSNPATATTQEKFSDFDPALRTTKIGYNVYLKHKSGASKKAAAAKKKHSKKGNADKFTGGEEAQYVPSVEASKQAAAGVNILSDLINPGAADGDFKLDLFAPGRNEGPTAIGEGSVAASDFLTFDERENNNPELDKIMKGLSDLDNAPAVQQSAEDADLLDLIGG